jgi:hypothetical protein
MIRKSVAEVPDHHVTFELEAIRLDAALTKFLHEVRLVA